MTHPVQSHDFASGVCVHCHAPESNVAASQNSEKPITCVTRWIGGHAPGEERGHTGFAADDFDAVGARFRELRKEQDEALATVVEDPIVDDGFCNVLKEDIAAFNLLQNNVGQYEASLLADSHKLFMWFCDVVDPEYSSGRMVDAIGKIYYVSREPGETPQEFEQRVKNAVLVR
jgi:hypothetical protein